MGQVSKTNNLRQCPAGWLNWPTSSWASIGSLPFLHPSTAWQLCGNVIPFISDKQYVYREVHLKSNQLSSFPAAFCQSSLTQLALLDLSNNSITEIPAEIRSLQALELNLNDNKVAEVLFWHHFPDIKHPSWHLPMSSTSNPESGTKPAHPWGSSFLRPQVPNFHRWQCQWLSAHHRESKVSLLCLEGNNIDKKALVRMRCMEMQDITWQGTCVKLFRWGLMSGRYTCNVTLRSKRKPTSGAMLSKLFPGNLLLMKQPIGWSKIYETPCRP